MADRPRVQQRSQALLSLPDHLVVAVCGQAMQPPLRAEFERDYGQQARAAYAPAVDVEDHARPVAARLRSSCVFTVLEPEFAESHV